MQKESVDTCDCYARAESKLAVWVYCCVANAQTITVTRCQRRKARRNTNGRSDGRGCSRYTRRKAAETISLESYIHVGGFSLSSKIAIRLFVAHFGRASGNWPPYHNSRHWPGQPPCQPHSLFTGRPLCHAISPSRRCWYLLECAVGDCSEGYRIAYPPRCVRRIPKHLLACLARAAAAEDRSGPAYDLDDPSEILDLSSGGSGRTYCE